MKNETVKGLGTIFGVILVVLLVGLGIASLVTFVIGLFVVFPFTLINVLKVWLAIIVINIAFSGLRTNR